MDDAAGSDSAAGLHRLGLDGARDGLVYIPREYRSDLAAPLVLLLHGAGAAASELMPRLTALADKYCLIVLVPDSRRSTWDLFVSDYGADVAFIDRALKRVFEERIGAPRIFVSHGMRMLSCRPADAAGR